MYIVCNDYVLSLEYVYCCESWDKSVIFIFFINVRSHKLRYDYENWISHLGIIIPNFWKSLFMVRNNPFVFYLNTGISFKNK